MMLSAAAYVATYQSPTPPTWSVDAFIERRMGDFLGTSASLPGSPGPCGGTTGLEQLIVESFAGETARWKQKRDGYFGPAVENNLYLWNGRALYPLHEERDFLGATSTLPLMPDFRWVKPVGASGVDGLDNVTYHVAAMRGSELVRLNGDAVRISVTSTSGLTEQTSTAWAPTALVGGADGGGRITNITWTKDANPALVRQLLPADVDWSFPSRTSEFSLQLTTHGESTKDTLVTIVLPAGWNATRAGDEKWDGSWTSTGHNDVVTLRANATVPPGGSTARFFARAPANTTRPFDVFTAQLGNGSFGQSSLVVRFPHALDRELPREAFPTVPYPVRAGEHAFFGVAFANGGEALVVKQVDVEIPGGYDFARNGGRGVELFADAPLAPVEPVAGWSRVDARHVRWRGNVSLEPSEAAWWGVGVRVTTDPTQSTSIEGASGSAAASTLRFGNGYADASTLWSSSPGILRHRVPPAREGTVGYAGGAADVGASLSFEASVNAYRTQLSQAWSYDVTPEARLLQLQNGVTNASLQVADRRAPLGSVVQAEVDVQSLVTSLAGQGIADAALNVSVYAPPSMGCHPTASWRVGAASMPKAEALAVELWDPVPGLGSLYLGAGDGQAYRVEATGSPLWTRDLGARPSAFLPLPGGALLAGDELGNVRRIDAATGLPAWSTRVGSMAVTSLAHDAAGDAVLAGTFDGRLALLDAADGALLASFQGAEGMAYTHARFAADGAVIAINGSVRVERFTAGLAREAASPPGAYLAVAHASGGLLAATATGWDELDAATLAPAARHDAAAPVLHAAAGDVDGDGAEDLALALEDLTVVLVDGATRAAATRTPTTPFSTTRLGPGAVLGPVGAAACALAGESATYRDSPLCTLHERNKPYALRVEDGRVAYAYAQAGQPHVCLYDDGLSTTWCRGLDAARVPTRLAIGPYGAGRGVAIATADGTVEVRANAGGDVLLATSPAQSVGRLAIRAPVPLGGFLGAHLLVANVEWTDALGKAHAVGLADWFQVVDVDGTPVTSPAYRVVMVGRDLGEPALGG